MRIVLFRHGETRLNAEKKYQGHDIQGLSPAGIESVRASIERLAPSIVSDEVTVVSSDSPRARETTEIILDHLRGLKKEKVPVRYSSNWRELDFGEWTGLSYLEVTAEGGEDQLRRFYDDPWSVAPPGGENLGQLAERVVKGLEELRDLDMAKEGAKINQTLIVVSHSGPIRAALMVLDGNQGDMESFWGTEIKPADYVERALPPADEARGGKSDNG